MFRSAIRHWQNISSSAHRYDAVVDGDEYEVVREPLGASKFADRHYTFALLITKQVTRGSDATRLMEYTRMDVRRDIV